MTLEEKIIDLEIYIANQEKMIQDLDKECIRMSKLIDTLLKQNKLIIEQLKESPVKPLSEETKPPHY